MTEKFIAVRNELLGNAEYSLQSIRCRVFTAFLRVESPEEAQFTVRVYSSLGETA